MKGIFITGTDTGVGKTWVAASLIRQLHLLEKKIIPRKPVESGWDSNKITETDAWQLADAANQLDNLNKICPNRFILPSSPARAARKEGFTLSIKQLRQQCTEDINDDDFLVVEGAGGFYSPIAHDGLNSDLAIVLDLPVILIATNRLGSINQVLLSVAAIKKSNLDLIAIVLNQSSQDEQLASFNKQLQLDNIADIKSLVKVPVLSNGYLQTNNELYVKLAKLSVNYS